MNRHITFVLIAAGLAIAGAAACFGSSDDAAGPTVPSGFEVTVVAHIRGPRELVAAPNGDLIVGTMGNDVMIVPRAEDAPGEPRTFVHLDDGPAAGVALGDGMLYVGSAFGVWRVAYTPGDLKAREPAIEIARVRTSGTPGSHVTTSVAVSGKRLYASIGSSCNACDPELDATRATVQELQLDGKAMHPKAVHIRNAIALTVDGGTGALWAGVAGQDELEHGHPYEIFDEVTAHAGTVDYGWPSCYENHRAAQAGHDCSHQTVPRVVFPAYETPIGAAFYPANEHGRNAFPSSYAGGVFVALHGSWHRPLVPPRVVFVPMRDDQPKVLVDWTNPGVQWREFMGGFQAASGERVARPTGVAMGSQGSLFVAADIAGVIYRIRPRRGA